MPKQLSLYQIKPRSGTISNLSEITPNSKLSICPKSIGKPQYSQNQCEKLHVSVCQTEYKPHGVFISHAVDEPTLFSKCSTNQTKITKSPKAIIQCKSNINFNQNIQPKFIQLKRKNQKLALKMNQFQEQNQLLRQHIQKLLQENKQWNLMYTKLLNNAVEKSKINDLLLSNFSKMPQNKIHQKNKKQDNFERFLMTTNKEIKKLSFNQTKNKIQNLIEIISQGQTTDRTNEISQVIENWAQYVQKMQNKPQFKEVQKVKKKNTENTNLKKFLENRRNFARNQVLSQANFAKDGSKCKFFASRKKSKTTNNHCLWQN